MLYMVDSTEKSSIKILNHKIIDEIIFVIINIFIVISMSGLLECEMGCS